MKRIFLVVVIISCASSAWGQSLHKNVALNKTVFVVSQEELASAAVDGNNASFWQSGSSVGTHWLTIDLGNDFTIDRVVTPKFTGVDSLVVEVWTDENWKVVAARKPNMSGGNSPDNPLFGFEPIRTNRVRIRSVEGKQLRLYEVQAFEYNPQPVYVNQSGYNSGYPKRFTAPLASNGAKFIITYADDNSDVLFEGKINNNIGDFTNFYPGDTGPFVVTVNEKENSGKSVPFRIGPNWIQRVSYQPAINFMIDSRCWFGDSRKFEPTEESAGCPTAGVAWRDSHQMSFEIQSLLNLYFANPSAFTVERMPVQGTYLGMREELPEDTPEIVRLIYWAVDIYLRGKVNHTLLKEQLAYFVYAWPWLSEYIPRSVYEKARDYTFSVWDNEQINRWRWQDIEHTGNLFQTYKIIGTGKGQFPPGHSVIPNLMMYEVAKRENRENAERFFRAAYDQTAWLIENLDWNNPRTTKGQRQGEQVTITSLHYLLEQYPDRDPGGIKEKISDLADVIIRRSNNMWDFRRYSDDKWIIPSIRPESDPRFDPVTGFNEVGNVAGFPAPTLAAASVVDNQETRNRLKQLAISHVDHVFGRNPTGRHFSFDAALDFEGVEMGWFQEYQGGAGILQTARGVLDGSPKETLYPFNPHAGDPGHTEGWVTFNTPWNIALAYLSADVTAIEIYDKKFSEKITSIQPGRKIGIEVIAPLNFNYAKKERAQATIYFKNQINSVGLEEVGYSSNKFRGIYEIPEGKDIETIKVAYGYAWHEKGKELQIRP
mgnify:CR=1 FL=1